MPQVCGIYSIFYVVGRNQISYFLCVLCKAGFINLIFSGTEFSVWSSYKLYHLFPG